MIGGIVAWHDRRLKPPRGDIDPGQPGEHGITVGIDLRHDRQQIVGP
jgi:hypothetical protein